MEKHSLIDLPNEIVLRPRFQDSLDEVASVVLMRLEKSAENPILVKRMDDHVFIRFNDSERHFWSPQLQLEVLDEEQGGCKVYGLYGPNPTLWTFFMFLHFGVATLFIILGIWAYTSASLGRPYGVLIGGMAAMLVIWFAFYAFGRAGRAKGKPQMHQLYRFYKNALKA